MATIKEQNEDKQQVKFLPVSQVMMDGDEDKYLINLGLVVPKVMLKDTQPKYMFKFNKLVNKEETDPKKMKFKAVEESALPMKLREMVSAYFTGFQDGSLFTIQSQMRSKKSLKSKLNSIDKKLTKNTVNSNNENPRK